MALLALLMTPTMLEKFLFRTKKISKGCSKSLEETVQRGSREPYRRSAPNFTELRRKEDRLFKFK